jgi:predicted SAM-dependent methyltransferase
VLGTVWTRLRYIAKSGARRRLRDLVLRAGRGDIFTVREDLARRYLTGSGIEIGALTFPLRKPRGVQTRFVDYLSREDLVRAYGANLAAAGLDPDSIPEVNVVDDAQRLARFDDESVDFVVANHVLEHLEDPVGALRQLLRVIRSRGILYLTLPDARYTFDASRARTTVQHLLHDHAEGPLASRLEHYEEWARFNEALPDDRVADRVAQFTREGEHHHFHVWQLEDFLELLRALELPCELQLAQATQPEFAVILRKT